MSASTSDTLKNLIALAKVDSALAGIAVERKRQENQLSGRKASVKEKGDRKSVFEQQTRDRRQKLEREEREIKEEQEKLVARRRALSTFSNYKLQQAAQKEIEQAAYLLTAREETVLKAMAELEDLEKRSAESTEAYTVEVTTYESNLKEITELFTTLEDRSARYMEDRERIAPTISPQDLTLYNRVKNKYPVDPVVPLKGSSCSGCFMQVGPQIVVLASKGQVTRCPGCGRIVYLEESKEE